MRIQMSFKKKAWSVFCLLLTTSTVALAGEGGATSGGGDDDGLLAQQSLHAVVEMIKSDDHVFSATDRSKLLMKAAIARIVMLDSQVFASTAVGTQTSLGFSRFDGTSATIAINRARLMKVTSLPLRETFIFHELAVLAGLERTGDYHLSEIFKTERLKIWERMLSQGLVCTFSAFEKSNTPFGIRPSKMIGATSIVLRSTDMKSEITPITSGRSNVLSMLWSADGAGMLRGKFARTDIAYTLPPNYSSSQTQVVTSDIRAPGNSITFFSPYDLSGSTRESNLYTYENLFIMIACAKL